MNKYLKLYESHSQYVNPEIRPNVSYCRLENEVHYNPYVHDYSQDYLTFVSHENGTISFNILKNMGTDMITSISYSTDNGETWTTTNNTDNKEGNLVITVNVLANNKILWKGIATHFCTSLPDIAYFSSTARFDVMGNIMSLCYGDNFIDKNELELNFQFCGLFADLTLSAGTLLINAKNLVLPAMTLTQGCYGMMFMGCSNLVTAPSCLPALSVPESAYGYMFMNCTSLIKAPELPATTVGEYSYLHMFQGCTNLITAPELPATTLAEECYALMFYECTSLTIAPELPATTLVDSCYLQMFFGCTNLSYIKAMFTTTPSGTYTSNWVNGVAASGTFVKNAAAQWDVTGVNGIPSGWTVQTASE